MTQLVALPNGTVLAGDYKIRRVLGAGGFGVTYLADETALGRPVSIKEYFPSDFAARDDAYAAAPKSKNCTSDYTWGLDRFIEEAQTLARFNHPHIVRVYRVFRANGTAYMVLHFEEGQSLKSWLKSLGRAPRQKEIDAILPSMLDALETIHQADFLHRDLAPDNIIIRKSGDPVLIDFGAARGELAAHFKTKTVSALVKPGYSPYEQYAESSRQQGPWTDIYALSATLYHCVTGKRPPDSPSRMLNDEMIPVGNAALASYRTTFLDGITSGLALAPDARPQSVAAWRGQLLAPEPARPGMISRLKDKSEKQKTSQRSKAARPTQTATPPPPDAPGPQGGLLDFVDALKSPNRPPPETAAGAAKTPHLMKRLAGKAGRKGAAETVAKADAAKLSPKQKPKPPPSTAAVAKALAPPVGRKQLPAKPDVVRRSPLFRSLVTKLSMAAVLTGLLIGFRDQIPRVLAVPQAQMTTGAITASEVTPKVVERARFTAHSGDIHTVAFSGDGRLLVTMGATPDLKVWSAESHALNGIIPLAHGKATSLSVRNDRAVTAHEDGSVTVHDLRTLQQLYHFKRNDAAIWSASFAGSQDRIVAASHDWMVSIWQTGDQQTPDKVLEGHRSAVQSVSSSPDGQWLATGGADRTVKLWNLQRGRLRRTYANQPDFVTALAFAPDERTFAAGMLNGHIKILSRLSSRSRRTFKGHNAKITSIAYSPSGDLLATAADDGSVRLRGLSKTRLYWTMDAELGGARSVAFSNDGDTLVTGGRDGVVRLWSLPKTRLTQSADLRR